MRTVVTFIGLTAAAWAADMPHVMGIHHERSTRRSQGPDFWLAAVVS